MKIIERGPTKEEETLVPLPENGYVVSDGNRLDSILSSLAKVLGHLGLQLTNINFGMSDCVLKIEPIIKDERPLGDLEFHKKLISGVTKLGVTGEMLRHHVQDVWDDAIKSTLVIDNEKKNTATDGELYKFSEFIAEDVNLNALAVSYEEEIFDGLWRMTNEELTKEKEFYDYEG
jgi:hypothetical protein